MDKDIELEILKVLTIVKKNQDLEEKKRFENITFFSSITTNGLLIDEFKIKIFKENKLQYFQITLDGYIEEHDSIRYISKKRGSYNIIIENIVMFKMIIKVLSEAKGFCL